MKNNFFSKNKLLFFAVIISLVVYHKWLSFSIFAYSDYVFQFFQTLRESPNFGMWDLTGFGMPNLFSWRLAGQNSILYSLFGLLGHDSNIADKFIVFWPWVILSCVSSYLLVRKITNSNIGAFVGSLVFSYSTYFLAINRSGHLLLSISSVFIIFSFYFFIKFLEEKQMIFAIATSLSLAVTGFYDFRNLYIALWIFFFYFFFYYFAKLTIRPSFIKEGLRAAIPIIIFGLLHLFWILPGLFSGSLSENTVLARNLFGSHFFHITRALTLFHPFWTGGAIEWFVVQPIPLYLWSLPLLAFLGVATNTKNKDILFFSGLSLLGILLSKQTGEPFDHFYEFLFRKMPGFSAFREASKFYVLISIGYSVLIGGFIKWIVDISSEKTFFKKMMGYAVIVCVSCLLLWNAKPVFTGSIGSMFIPRTLHSDYFIYRDFILSHKEYFRVLWSPVAPRWALSTLEQPVISNMRVMDEQWKAFVEFYTIGTTWPQKATNLFFRANADNFFDQSSVRYIATPVDDFENDADVYVYYGRTENKNIRAQYIKELQKVPWLKQVPIPNLTEMAIFENLHYKSHIYTSPRIDYVTANTTDFNAEAKDDTAFLNSRLAQTYSHLLPIINRVVVPVDADPKILSVMQKNMYEELDGRKARKLFAEFDFYTGGYFLKDFTLSIPKTGMYSIYLKSDSVLAQNPFVKIKIDTVTLSKKTLKGVENFGTGWSLYNMVQLEQGTYPIGVFINSEVAKAVNRQDIIFVSEDTVEDFALPKIEYRRVGGTKYIMNVSGAKSSFPLVFSESFHPDWKLFVKKDVFQQSETGYVGENNQGTVQNDKLKKEKWYEVIKRDSDLDKNHFQINNFANAWWVDINELQKNGKIVPSADGTYSFSIIIELGTNKYFYIGSAISLITGIFCIIYLLYKFLFWLYNRFIRS